MALQAHGRRDGTNSARMQALRRSVVLQAPQVAPWMQEKSCMHAQLDSVAQRLQRLEQERSAPGRERPEDALYLARLSADAEREALNRLRVEVRWFRTATVHGERAVGMSCPGPRSCPARQNCGRGACVHRSRRRRTGRRACSWKPW